MTFLDERVVAFLHDHALAQHGGLPGIRDKTLLQSALARPRHLAHDQPTSDVFALAAAYAYGISRNHPVNDGNKRTAWAACVTLLRLHNVDIDQQIGNEARVLCCAEFSRRHPLRDSVRRMAAEEQRGRCKILMPDACKILMLDDEPGGHAIACLTRFPRFHRRTLAHHRRLPCLSPVAAFRPARSPR